MARMRPGDNLRSIGWGVGSALLGAYLSYLLIALMGGSDAAKALVRFQAPVSHYFYYVVGAVIIAVIFYRTKRD